MTALTDHADRRRLALLLVAAALMLAIASILLRLALVLLPSWQAEPRVTPPVSEVTGGGFAAAPPKGPARQMQHMTKAGAP